MTIREILDLFDKEIAGHRTAIKRLEDSRGRILDCCRTEAEARREGRARPAEEGSKSRVNQGEGLCRNKRRARPTG